MDEDACGGATRGRPAPDARAIASITAESTPAPASAASSVTEISKSVPLDSITATIADGESPASVNVMMSALLSSSS